MTIQTNTFPSTLMAITVIAIALLGSVTAVMTVAAAKPIRQTPTHVASNDPSKVTCTECGLVESVLVIDTDTVRADGPIADTGQPVRWELNQASAVRATVRF